MLKQSRQSIERSTTIKDDYEKLKRSERADPSDDEITQNVLPLIFGSTQIIPHQVNKVCTNFAPLTDGTLCQAKPGLFDGVKRKDVHESVLHSIGTEIAPTTETSSPILPNFFMEVQGYMGSHFKLMMRSLYDGALGARAVSAAQSFIGGEARQHDGEGFSMVATYGPYPGFLHLNVTHRTKDEESGKPRYRERMLGSWKLTESMEDFVRGVTALRNAREWARDERTRLVAQMNSTAAQAGGAQRSTKRRREVDSTPLRGSKRLEREASTGN